MNDMFEEYLEDASYFFNQARESRNDKLAKRYYRACVFCTANAIEAFVNYFGDVLAKGGPLQAHEVAFLNDKEYVFKIEESDLLVQRRQNHALEDKLGLLTKRFVQGFDFKANKDWKNLNKFKEFRNGLVHPRKAEDDMNSNDYDVLLHTSIISVITLMNVVHEGMFHQSLRKKLLDLMPD